jgi:hypothetical protein
VAEPNIKLTHPVAICALLSAIATIMPDQMTGTLSHPLGMLIHWITSLASLIG